MTVVLASDLDRTLIYSRRAARLPDPAPALVTVEVHDGADASFMTAPAAAQLARLATQAALVPVTTRIPAQFARVNLPGPPPRFAVCSNGGHLYADGTLDRAWSRQVTRVLRAGVPLREVWDHAGQVCRAEFTHKLRNAADLFCYAVVRPDHLPPGFVDDVTGWAAERGWRTSLQGRKLYWVPAGLTKSAAVAEVARRLDAGRIVAAGDSLLDVDLLLAADAGVHPRHGELFESGWSAPTVECTQDTGVLAGEEIVRWFAAAAR